MGENLDNLKRLKSGYEYLDDLRFFSDSDSIPVIDQVAGVFDRLWGSFATKQNSLRDCHIIESLIRREIHSSLENHLLERAEFKELQVSFSDETFTAHAWEYVLFSLQLGLSALRLLNSKESLIVKIGPEKTTLRSYLSPKNYSNEVRTSIYKLFRMALDRNVLQSFKLEEDDSGRALIDLVFDYSHSDFKWMTFSLPENQLFLKFSNILENYRVDVPTIKNGPVQGSAIVLSSDGKVTSYDSIDNTSFSQIYDDNEGIDVFHFPFIFRPVWLIIPVKGVLKDASVIGVMENHQSIDWREAQSQYLDLFKLLSR